MKGTTFTVRDFELRDATGIGFWMCERDGWEVSCALADDPTTQPEGQPYFARVALFGADFGSADGATPDEAVALAFAKADLGIARIVMRAQRGHGSSSPEEFHKHLVELACEAFARTPSGNGRVFEVEVRERMAQAASVYALDCAPQRERTAEPAFIPSEPPVALLPQLPFPSRVPTDEQVNAVLASYAVPAKYLGPATGSAPRIPDGVLAASGCGTEDRCLDCLADPCTCELDGLDLEEQLDVALGEEPPPGAPLFTVSEDPNDYRYTLDAMRDANAGDAHVLAWLDSAKVGDVLDTMHGATVTRVA